MQKYSHYQVKRYKELKKNFFNKKYFKNIRTEHKLRRIHEYAAKRSRDFSELIQSVDKDEIAQVTEIFNRLEVISKEAEALKAKCLAVDNLIYLYYRPKKLDAEIERATKNKEILKLSRDYDLAKKIIESFENEDEEVQIEKLIQELTR